MTMKMVLIGSFTCVALSMLQPLHAQEESAANDGFKTIFNGENWDGWYLKIREGGEESANKIFAIEDGVVHVFKDQPDKEELNTGNNATHGMCYTNKKYSKYILKFEYKWGSKIFNNFQQWQYDAGCYYHVIDDKIWPKGVEYQIRYDHLKDRNHTGDLIIAGVKAKWYSNEDEKFCLPKDGGTAQTFKDWLYLAAPDVEFNGLNDKWNQCEIVVMADKYVIHKLNGTIVNMASDLSVGEGKIGLQSETAEIFYRDIKIKEFDEIVPMEMFLDE